MSPIHDAHLLNCGCLVELPDPHRLGQGNGRQAVVHRHPACTLHSLTATSGTYSDLDGE